MPHSDTAHSFRRLLDKNDKAYREYVLSEQRYRGLIDFLRTRITMGTRSQVLDVGCGAGVISRGLASEFDHVTGIDGNADNIDLAESFARDAEMDNVAFAHALATELPVPDASMDLVLLNGVLEWVGANTEGEDPKARQIRVLQEARRVLRPDGVLYLGIENRWHPATLLRDPHSQLPLVNALPRTMANRLSLAKTGKPFQTYIYGFSTFKQLLREAGFSNAGSFVPFPGYHYPVAYVRAHPRQAALADIAAIDTAKVQKVLDEAGRNVNVDYAIKRIRQKAKVGLLKLLAHDFAFIAQKNDQKNDNSSVS